MNRRLGRQALAVGVVVVAGVAALAGDAGALRGPKALAQAVMRDANGAAVGRVFFVEGGRGGKVNVQAAFKSLPAGFHGFHVHAVGRCEAPFTTAGGHLSAASSNHPSHAGDMPVLLVNQDGTASAAFHTDRFRLDDLVDADGSAVIVHASPDNYANIPSRYAPAGPDAATLATGDSGGRIACGVVQRFGRN